VARPLILLLVLGALALPARGGETPDCSAWSFEEFRPGMPFEEAQRLRSFREAEEHPDPLGYRRYVWQAPDRPAKVELHVDLRADPPRVIGVMATVPTAVTPPEEFRDTIVARLGPPLKVVNQGAFRLYTWGSSDCDVSVRMSVMVEQHDVGIWIGFNQASARDEFSRRKREARPASGGDQPATQAGSPGEGSPEQGEDGDD